MIIMENELKFEFEIYGKIKKPVAEVFDAVYNHEKLSGYFTTGGASGPLDTGKTVMWDFHDHPGAFPVHVVETVPQKSIKFRWNGGEGVETEVLITFEAIAPDATLLKIHESGWKQTPDGLKRSYGNAMGWTQMMCCLKVYVEYGKNLREFFF